VITVEDPNCNSSWLSVKLNWLKYWNWIVRDQLWNTNASMLRFNSSAQIFSPVCIMWYFFNSHPRKSQIMWCKITKIVKYTSVESVLRNFRFSWGQPDSRNPLAWRFQTFPATALKIQTEIYICQDENSPFIQACANEWTRTQKYRVVFQK
jgi:hypothetical protein